MIPRLTWRQEQDNLRSISEGGNSEDLKEHFGLFVSSQISNVRSLFSKLRKHAEEDVTSLEANMSLQDEKQIAENSKFWSPADLQREGPQTQQPQIQPCQMPWGSAGSRDLPCSLPRRHLPYPRHETSRFDSCAASRSPRRGDSSPTSPSRFPFARRNVCWPPPSRLNDDAMPSPTAAFSSRPSLVFQPPPPLIPPAPTSSSCPPYHQQQTGAGTYIQPGNYLSTPLSSPPAPSEQTNGQLRELTSQSSLSESAEAVQLLPDASLLPTLDSAPLVFAAVAAGTPPQPVPSPARLEEEDS